MRCAEVCDCRRFIVECMLRAGKEHGQQEVHDERWDHDATPKKSLCRTLLIQIAILNASLCNTDSIIILREQLPELDKRAEVLPPHDPSLALHLLHCLRILVSTAANEPRLRP